MRNYIVKTFVANSLKCKALLEDATDPGADKLTTMQYVRQKYQLPI